MKKADPLMNIHVIVKNFLLSVWSNPINMTEPNILPAEANEPKNPYPFSSNCKSRRTCFFEEERTPLSPLITIEREMKIMKMNKRATRESCSCGFSIKVSSFFSVFMI